MKKILLILSFFVSYSAYAQYVPKAGNKLNVKPNGILVPTSSADDTPIARLEVFASGVSTIKPTALPIASASLLGAFRVGTGLSIDGSGILSTVGGSAPDTTIYRTVANSRSLAQTQTALNAKQNNIILTTTGTSGAATLIGSTLNIPNYATGGGGSQTLDQVLTTGNTSTQNATVGGLSASNRIAIGSALDVNYLSKFSSSNADNFNAFVSTAGTGEYGIYDNALYFQALTLSNGIRFYGNNAAPNPGLSVNSSNNVVIQSSLNLSPLTASTLLKLDASRNVINAVSGTDFVAPASLLNLTATNGTLTFSGSYNTTTARTVGLNLGNANTWTAQQSGTTPTAKDNTTKFATTAFVGKQFTATGSGTGAATTISFAHGVSGVTSANSVIVTPNNAAAAGLIYVTLDATNVNVVYSVAPASGTNNLAYSVSIK